MYNQINTYSEQPESLAGVITTHKENPVPYNASLLIEINDKLLLLRKRYLLALNALGNLEREEFLQRFGLYQETLKEYLKLVSSNLYLHLRFALQNEEGHGEFLRFEEHTLVVNRVAAKFMRKYNNPRSNFDGLFEAAFYKLDKFLKERHEAEKEYLYPLYQPRF